VAEAEGHGGQYQEPNNRRKRLASHVASPLFARSAIRGQFPRDWN
jgi:hypothetical protein